MPLSPCKHRWSILQESHYDRWNWVSVERCRKCNLIEQAIWVISQRDGRTETKCDRSIVYPTQIDNVKSISE